MQSSASNMVVAALAGTLHETAEVWNDPHYALTSRARPKSATHYTHPTKRVTTNSARRKKRKAQKAARRKNR